MDKPHIYGSCLRLATPAAKRGTRRDQHNLYDFGQRVWKSVVTRVRLVDGYATVRSGESDDGGFGKGAVLWRCSVFDRKAGMGNAVEEEEEGLGKRDAAGDVASDRNGAEDAELLTDSVEDSRGSSSSTDAATNYSDLQDSPSFSEESQSLPLPDWPERGCSVSGESIDDKGHIDGEEEPDSAKVKHQQKPKYSEIEMMKERFAKLLLGEDMSGCGNGVPTALAISNAITNLCATLFGQLWRLEPLSTEKKLMWRREIEWLLCVSDHIVELTPTWQTFPDGTKLEVMTCRPRSDLYINLPALRKLDNMLIDILNSFTGTDFWYVDQGILAPDCDGSSSFRKPLQRQEEKWWLPVPRVPPGGLSDKPRKQLQHKRESTNQILKAVMAINNDVLAEMEVPESYLESLPKTGRQSLGDVIHRYITSDQFSPECLLDCLDLTSEHQALEIANRVEAAIFVWRKRATSAKPPSSASRGTPRSSWGMVKDLIVDGEKQRELLAERAECLLMCLKQRFPNLTQTILDMSKIQSCKDMGKSILESYSRVLESLAFNIIARIDDVLYVDDLTKHSDKLSPIPAVSIIAHRRVSIPYSVPVSGTPYATAYATPNFSPAPLVSPAARSGGETPLIGSRKPPLGRGASVKKVLTEYLGVDSKVKSDSNKTAQESDVLLYAARPDRN